MPRSDENCLVYQLAMGVSLLLNAGIGMYGFLEGMINSELQKTNEAQKRLLEEMQRNYTKALEENMVLRREVEIQGTYIVDLQLTVEGLKTQVEVQNRTIQAQGVLIKRQEVDIVQLNASNGLLSKMVELQKASLIAKDKLLAKQNYTVVALGAANILLTQTVKTQGETITKQDYANTALSASNEILRAVVRTENITINAQKYKLLILQAEVGVLNDTVILQKAQLAEKDTIIMRLREEIHKFPESMKELRLTWIKYKILEKYNKTVTLEPRFHGGEKKCDNSEFHTKCGNIRPNVFVATEDGTEQVFGGFTNESFDDHEWKRDEKAFTFSLSSLQTCTLQNPDRAIYTSWRYLVLWKVFLGYGEYDIWLNNNCVNDAHAIEENKTYLCPKNNNTHFYTIRSNPHLSSLDFYEVKINA